MEQSNKNFNQQPRNFRQPRDNMEQTENNMEQSENSRRPRNFRQPRNFKKAETGPLLCCFNTTVGYAAFEMSEKINEVPLTTIPSEKLDKLKNSVCESYAKYFKKIESPSTDGIASFLKTIPFTGCVFGYRGAQGFFIYKEMNSAPAMRCVYIISSYYGFDAWSYEDEGKLESLYPLGKNGYYNSKTTSRYPTHLEKRTGMQRFLGVEIKALGNLTVQTFTEDLLVNFIDFSFTDDYASTGASISVWLSKRVFDSFRSFKGRKTQKESCVKDESGEGNARTDKTHFVQACADEYLENHKMTNLELKEIGKKLLSKALGNHQAN